MSSYKESHSAFTIAVFISGRGSNFRALAASLPDSAQIIAVLSDREDAQGLDFAREKGIQTLINPRRKKEQSLVEFNLELVQKIQGFNPDLIVLAGFMQILTKEFISAFPRKVINIHPSLLPAFKGLDVHRKAIDAGAKFSGCTVHFVAEEVDAGPIIAQAVVPVLQDDTPDTLAARVLAQEHRILPAVVGAIVQRKITTTEGEARITIEEDILDEQLGMQSMLSLKPID